MTQTSRTLTGTGNPTQHAMLIVWGEFAREIGLMEQLRGVKIRQKRVIRAPYEKLAEFLIGLLSGMEYLSDLSESAAPLASDGEVATAWRLNKLADASGVSKTLKASDEQTLATLAAALEAVERPFLLRAVTDLRQKGKVFQLDADLTGRAVSSTSSTFPGAAFGYMDGEIRLGYQLAEICLQTDLYGRQWLGAQHHPGDTVSAGCLFDLLQVAERRLGCHPRRRVDLLQVRVEALRAGLADLLAKTEKVIDRLHADEQRIAHLSTEMRLAQVEVDELEAVPLSSRQDGPFSRLNRLKQQLSGWQSQHQRAEMRLEQIRRTLDHYQVRIEAAQATYRDLAAQLERFRAENAAQVDPPHFCIRLDAGFSSGENLTRLIELGYDVETKSANDALVKALRSRAADSTAGWTTVGKNAEMMAWTDYFINTCPYPLTVGLERFHTPKGQLHAVLIRSQAHEPAALPHLPTWFHAYNGRQTIEAGNKEEKTTFKVQHLMCRGAAGIRIQAMLTVFATNFVRWAQCWVRSRVEQSNRRFDQTLASPKRLVRVAANSPATVLRSEDRVSVHFSRLSSLGGVVITVPFRACSPIGQNDHFAHF